MTSEEAKNIIAKPLKIIAFILLPVMLGYAVVSGYRTYLWIKWQKEPFAVKTISIGDTTLRVLTAVNPYQWRTGLSAFPVLPDSINGMLFIFPKEDSVAFWTVGMKYPISIYFLDKNFKIRGWVSCAEPCNKPPCDVYTALANYVLEVKCKTKSSSISLGELFSMWEDSSKKSPAFRRNPSEIPTFRRSPPFRVLDFSLPKNHLSKTRR